MEASNYRLRLLAKEWKEVYRNALDLFYRNSSNYFFFSHFWTDIDFLQFPVSKYVWWSNKFNLEHSHKNRSPFLVTMLRIRQEMWNSMYIFFPIRSAKILARYYVVSP